MQLSQIPTTRKIKYERIVEIPSARTKAWEKNGYEVSQPFRIGNKLFERRIWNSNTEKFSIYWLATQEDQFSSSVHEATTSYKEELKERKEALMRIYLDETAAKKKEAMIHHVAEQLKQLSTLLSNLDVSLNTEEDAIIYPSSIPEAFKQDSQQKALPRSLFKRRSIPQTPFAVSDKIYHRERQEKSDYRIPQHLKETVTNLKSKSGIYGDESGMSNPFDYLKQSSDTKQIFVSSRRGTHKSKIQKEETEVEKQVGETIMLDPNVLSSSSSSYLSDDVLITPFLPLSMLKHRTMYNQLIPHSLSREPMLCGNRYNIQ